MSQNSSGSYGDPQGSSYGSDHSSYGQNQSSYGQNQPYGQPSPYGAYGNQPAGYGAHGGDHPRATTVLVLGIIGLFFSIVAPFALFMGNSAKKEIANGAPYRWGGSLQAGWILGIIGTIFLVLGLLWLIFVVVIGVSTGY